MVAVISSKHFISDIDNVVGEDIVFQKIDSDIDLSEELEKVSRINVNFLIIDISCISDKNKITQPIMNYKMKKENTRIIVIAPNFLPGDPMMSFLFSLGIWDIINPQGEVESDLTIHQSLEECLRRRASYVRGVKWFTCPDNVQQTGIKTIPEKEIKERTIVIEKGKIIGTAIIAVAGTMNRIGTTHTVIALAAFLNELKHKISVVELHNSQSFLNIKNSYEDVNDKGNVFTLDGLDFYPYSNGLNVLDVLQEDYDYVIFDMGTYSNCNIDEFRRANVRVIVSGVKDWELTSLESILATDEWILKNKYLFSFSDKNTFCMVKANMDKLECYQATYNPQPFLVGKDCSILYRSMLKDILPDTKVHNAPEFLNILRLFKKGSNYET